MGLTSKKEKTTEKAAPVERAAATAKVPVSNEALFQGKNKTIAVEGVEFLVTKVEGTRVELTRANYK